MASNGIHKAILVCLCCFIGYASLAEVYMSRDNYTGDWGLPDSWNPVWPAPQTDVSEHLLTIYGFITAHGSLAFSGTSKLTVRDTLVINGDISILDNNQLKIEAGAILIVWGNLIFRDSSQISVKGYLVVAGDILVNDTVQHGSFRSFSDPSQVFICGSIPTVLTDDNPNMSALNCAFPTSTPYPNSSCTYGNLTDLKEDPLYTFFMATCNLEAPTIVADGPTRICEGDSVTLNAGMASSYLWSTGDTTVSITVSASGIYDVRTTDAFNCQSDVSESVDVEVIALPVVKITNDSSICAYDSMPLTGSPAGGTFTITDGPGSLAGNLITANGPGVIHILYTYANECANSANQTIMVNEVPVVYAGTDQELDFQFSTVMNAELSPDEDGEWSLLSGSAVLGDIYSPVTTVSDLSVGENSFLWTVSNGICDAEAEVTVLVNDLFIPSVITPNGDGKNECFAIGAVNFRTELIIFNRWGIVEYRNSDYSNDWNGRNDRDEELPEDVYFYVLKFENAMVRKGSVMIIR